MSSRGVISWLRRGLFALRSAGRGVDCPPGRASSGLPPPSAAARAAAGNPGALGDPIVADHARQRSPRSCDRARPGVQHAARAGARPRRRVLHDRLSNRAPRISRGSPPPSIRSRRVLTEARARGIRVHAWVSLNLVSSAVELPASPGPSRLSPSGVADGAARRSRRTSRGSIRPIPDTSARSRAGRAAEIESVEGLYAIAAAARGRGPHRRGSSAIWRAATTLDGVHLDYARYPEPAVRLQPLRDRGVPRRHPAAARRRRAARARRRRKRPTSSPIPIGFPAEWKAFRRARMTALVARMRQARARRAARRAS